MIDLKYYSKCRDVQRLNGVYTHRNYNLMEHQYMTGMLFKHFASLENVPYDINVWDLVLNHDMVETITMDLPWPVKNFSDKTKHAWEIIEKELVYKHFHFSKYSDKALKEGMNERQFSLFKACDTLDLLIFVKEEMYYGNNHKEMWVVYNNCMKIFNSLDFKFKHIKKFIETL